MIKMATAAWLLVGVLALIIGLVAAARSGRNVRTSESAGLLESPAGGAAISKVDDLGRSAVEV